MRSRKDRLEIYYTILSRMDSDGMIDITLKPTELQKDCNISYEKLLFYIRELMEKGFIINRIDKLIITEKGYQFISYYKRLLDLTKDTDILR